MLNILITFTDCHYTTFGPNLLVHKEGTTVEVLVLVEELEHCEVACTEHPNCHSFQYCKINQLCTLKNRVLRESEATKFHFGCATYYKPCGKSWLLQKNVQTKPLHNLGI